MKLILSKNGELSEHVIADELKSRKLILIGADINADLHLEGVGEYSIEFTDFSNGEFIFRQLDKENKIKGRLNKKCRSTEIYTSKEFEFVIFPNVKTENEVTIEQNLNQSWDYHSLPNNPENPYYVQRLLRFLKEVVKSDQVAIFHRIDDHLHMIAQEGLKIKNQAEELIYQYIKEMDETIITINMHTHTMLFNAGLEPIDFHIIRQKIGKKSEVLIYIPLPYKDQVKFSQVKCITQLCAQSLALHLSYRFSKQENEAGPIELIGNSPEMIRLKNLAEKVKKTKINALVYGASSTGKMNLIKNIIDHDGLKYKRINCASLSVEELESTLFCIKKGVFQNKIYQGIVFENLHLMPKLIQEKLITVFEECDLRILATSEFSKEELIQNGFSSSLIYFIAEIIIYTPSLSERVEDIPRLAKHYLKAFCKNNDLEEKYLSPDFIKSLQSMNFVGNLGELKALISRSALVSDRKMINHTDLGIHMESSSADTFSWDLKKAKEEFTLSQIQKALKATSNNRNEAAKLLNISPRSLYRAISDNPDNQTDKVVTQ